MPSPEQPMYQLRNALVGMTEEVNAHVGDDGPCGSLDLTLHGIRRAVEQYGQYDKRRTCDSGGDRSVR